MDSDIPKRNRGPAISPLSSPATELEGEEERLLLRCRDGDLSAFHEIYTRFERPLLGTAFRLLGHRQDAEDAVHETFLKLYLHIDHYRSGSRFSTYLFRILLNSCIDILRVRKRRRTDHLDAESLPYQPYEEGLFHLQRAIDALPAQMRACFVLFAVEEFKLEEIADILDLRLGTVKATIFRAKARLRSVLMEAHKAKEAEA
jgi:RNA polymerase sigma-70 factor (ECF subfamily)